MPLTGLAIALQGESRAGSEEHSWSAVRAVDEQSRIREAQAGKRAAFQELVHRYDRDVLRLALNLLQRPEEARDVYQEAAAARPSNRKTQFRATRARGIPPRAFLFPER